MSLPMLYIIFALLPGLNTFMQVLAIVSGVLTGIFLFILLITWGTSELSGCSENTTTILFRTVKYTSITAIISFLLFCVIPDKTSLIEIYGINKISTVKGVSKLPENIVYFLNKQLKEAK